MKLRDISAFVAVVDAGSIQNAANRLRLTQSAVTRLIQRFEAELGVALFDRRTKPFKLTRDGELAVAHATRVLRSVEEMADALSSSAGPRGRVRIGVAHALAAVVVDGVSKHVRSVFPDVELCFRAAWTEHLIALVSAGDLDAALILLPRDRHPAEDLMSVRIFEDRLCIVGAKQDVPRTKRTLEMLNGKGWILNPDGCGSRLALEAAMARKNMALKILVEAHGPELQLGLVAQGLGYTLQPFRLLAPTRKRLSVIDVAGFEPRVTLWLTRSRRVGRASLVIDAVEKAARVVFGHLAARKS